MLYSTDSVRTQLVAAHGRSIGPGFTLGICTRVLQALGLEGADQVRGPQICAGSTRSQRGGKTVWRTGNALQRGIPQGAPVVQ